MMVATILVQAETDLSDFPVHPFWDFSLDVYMSDGVGQACLELQNEHQLDVNILLYCMWVGASGRGSLTVAQMAAVNEAVNEWHQDVVRALRAIRVRMKRVEGATPEPLTESLRQSIQKTEIDCEHAEQLMLAASVDLTADNIKTISDRLADSVSNISIYFAGFGKVSDVDRRNLTVILNVVFGDLTAEQVEAAAVKI
tara:strand:+ start:557 stop:1150 length:594 start_codon:yes stop_codon:yes gene_type:complete